MIAPSTSQPFPAAWTQAIADQALAHAIEAWPDEAAGIVRGGDYVRLFNRSIEPGEEIALSADDLLRVAEADVFFHSHPNGIGSPSAADMTYQQQLGIPFVIAVVPVVDVFAFGDGLGRAPLIGRGFRHGVHDCFSLMRDWYAIERQVLLPDCPREWEWWTKGKNLYLDLCATWGFTKIKPSEATEGDVLLFNFHQRVPMHGAIVMPKGLLLHHASGIRPVDATRLSAMVPRQRYQHLATHALRRRPTDAP